MSLHFFVVSHRFEEFISYLGQTLHRIWFLAVTLKQFMTFEDGIFFFERISNLRNTKCTLNGQHQKNWQATLYRSRTKGSRHHSIWADILLTAMSPRLSKLLVAATPRTNRPNKSQRRRSDVTATLRYVVN